MKLKIKKLREDAIIPTRSNPDDSGLDLYALESVLIYAGETLLVRTGIAFGIPEGFEIQVRPRSGLSLKSPLRIANSPGTVDRSYIGECCVIMTNTGNSGVCIQRGDRIAQAVLCPVIIPEVEEVDELSPTVRGDAGFGSTGK